MAPSHARKASNTGESVGRATSAGGRVAKRSDNACSRCRKQKIKCSGSHPCDACKKRKLSCEFDQRDQKILVTRGYILDLEQRASSSQPSAAPAEYVTPGSLDTNINVGGSSDQAESALRPTSSGDVSASLPTEHSLLGSRNSTNNSSNGLDPIASALVNPLSAGQSKFMASAQGRAFYLGTSSNWSFTRRALSLTHEYIHQSPIATDSLLFDGSAYDLGWDGSRITPPPEPPIMPSLDHAVFLINSVKFHCGQLFHLFDEETFMAYLHEFYADPNSHITAADLRYIHLLLILAFGKAFSENNNYQAKRPPGADYFVTALRLLPSIHILVYEPLISTEILCCIALYFESLDYRHSSHGFAMRVALGQGMHTDMPVDQLGEQIVERSRRIWWTVYVLDREMTSLMGLPQSLLDDDIHPQLPHFDGSTQRVAALHMQIRLCRSIASVGRGVYGANGRLNKKFLLSTKQVLQDIAGLADELKQQFPLGVDKAVNGVSRVAGYLHTLYHQCIVLATRPLLLCFLKIRFETPDAIAEALNSSQTVWNLIKMCIDSSYQMINILGCLQSQGLLEAFLPFDLESLFVSSFNLLIAPVLDPRFSEHDAIFRHKTSIIFSEMVTKGNLIAVFRRSELQQLDDMLSCLTRDHSDTTPIPIDGQIIGGAMGENSEGNLQYLNDDNETMASVLPGMDDLGLDAWFTTAQMIDMANSIANSDTEWVSHTMMEHDIW
ncbi:positive activator of transcription [Fusarium heterosporum]|uniref:Positive activator of transcription n=1 Tax=Fusarium heterosporum TaxID=42747 RepID=A0A8H5TKD1_FUSHE|nr:positive activator of transcription [Fusarium heterosporum]